MHRRSASSRRSSSHPARRRWTSGHWALLTSCLLLATVVSVLLACRAQTARAGGGAADDGAAAMLPGAGWVHVGRQAGRIRLAAEQGVTAGPAGPFRLAAFTAIATFPGDGLAWARTAALARGCNALTVAGGSTAPAGVRAHLVATGTDWPAWMAAHGVAAGSFGALAQADTAGAAGIPASPATGALLTIEPAWPFLDAARLAAQPWFTGAHSTEERAASEGSYYGGCVRAVTGDLAAAAARGWGGTAVSWRTAPATGGLPDAWAWERIAGPVVEQAAAWSLAVPADAGARAWSAALLLAEARARTGEGRRVRLVLPLAGLSPEEARALVLVPCFGGAEGLELRLGPDQTVPPPVLDAALDGLALAKACEPLLAAAAPVPDPGLAAAAAARRPLALRVRHAGMQAVLTYDPFWSEAGADRQATVEVLPGTTLELPAGRAARVFLLAEDAAPAAATGPAATAAVAAGADDPAALAALARLARLVPSFRIIDLPASGTLDIPAAATLTIDQLRGIALDDDPPILGKPPAYQTGVGDGLKPEARAFPARGIAPFRFRHFTNEFNITGRGSAELQDYASTRGFNLVAFRPRTRNAHLPPGTGSLKWLSRATPKDIDQHGRYDLLAERAEREDLAALYASDPFSRDSYTPRDPGTDLLMIDVEHGVLRPDTLRQQEWYPKDADPAVRAAFEARYYRGYRLMYTAAIEAGRRAGYPQISIYGWYTVPRTWWGLEKLKPDLATDWAWNTYGKDIYPLVDIIHPSVYCFYVSAQNVAYTLANLDLTRDFLQKAGGTPKPMRPYYWLKYHGGGAAGTNWWQNLPIVDEEVRAMHAMAFFTGIEGLDTWDWFGHPRFAGVPDPREDKHLMVGTAFSCAPEAGGEPRRFERYDVLHVLSGGSATAPVRFQRIRKDRGPDYGVGEGQPVYAMERDALRRHLRPWLENAAAMFEGMALAHPFEYLLRKGSIRLDQDPQQAFARALPLVRRVTLGRLHVLITYDPNVLYARMKAGEQTGLDTGTDHRLKVDLARAGKGIALEGFDGRSGITLRLPADDQPRIVVLRDP